MFENSRAVIDEWVARINAADYDAVVKLYDDAAILFPTFSHLTVSDREGLEDYFGHMRSRSAVHVEVYEATLHMQRYAPQLDCLTGIYRWHFSINGASTRSEARFTFVTNLDRAAPIIHHHSSRVPVESE